MQNYRDLLIAVMAALSVKPSGQYFVRDHEAMTIALGRAQIFMQKEYKPCPHPTDPVPTAPDLFRASG